MSIKGILAKNYINARGWSTNQKYVIIESDDWGAIRMPSFEVYHKLLKNNIEVDKFSFDKYDALESEDDLKALFETLQKFSDKKGNPAVLTAYHVVANPDFEKIETSRRKEYHYETILETYKRSAHTQQVPNLIKEGIDKGIYIPQSHGREHIHVKRWMEAINSDSEKEKLAFLLKAIIISKSKVCGRSYKKNYFAGQDYSDETEFNSIEEIIVDGLKMFETIFGFKSITFTPQGGFWGDHLLKILTENGVILACGQQELPIEQGLHKTVNKFWGQNNGCGQMYYRRNVLFEPSYNQDVDWDRKGMREIEIAFRWGKPAVISSHRANFIGSIFEDNRDRSLKKLSNLLKMIQKKWPEVQFISSHQLANIMISSLNNTAR
jgi:hypothetical protein